MRERMANEGLLLQMDGSPHCWNGKDQWCLIAAIDDATSKIPAAQFFPTETTWGCMAVQRTIIERFGVPEALYVDGAGWAGGGPKRQFFSQFVRAAEELGIRVIFATSAQAKGRIARFHDSEPGDFTILSHHHPRTGGARPLDFTVAQFLSS